MKRVYAEMILRGVMAEGSKNVISNILDWMETIDGNKSDNFMDIITGVEKRNIDILESFTGQEIINACEKYVKKETTLKVLSVSVISEVSYNDEFSTRPITVALYIYEYKGNNKLSPEKASEFESLKAEFIKRYDGKIVTNYEEKDKMEKMRSELYNFCSRNTYDGEDAVEVAGAGYSMITVTL